MTLAFGGTTISSRDSRLGVGKGFAGGSSGLGVGMETGARGMEAVVVGEGGEGTRAVSFRRCAPHPARNSTNRKITAIRSGSCPCIRPGDAVVPRPHAA